MSNHVGTSSGAGSMKQEPPPDAADGRTLRRTRNREAVIDSLVELIREGDLDPTIDKIAERAEVSPRSIFRYFTDLDDLARTAIEAAMLAAMPLASIRDRGEGSLEHRIDQLLAARERLFRSIHLLSIVAVRRSDEIEAVAAGLGRASELLLEQVRNQLAPELEGLGPADGDALAIAISASLGLEAWDHQRRRLGRTEDEIIRGWRLMLTRTFPGADR